MSSPSRSTPPGASSGRYGSPDRTLRLSARLPRAARGSGQCGGVVRSLLVVVVVLDRGVRTRPVHAARPSSSLPRRRQPLAAPRRPRPRRPRRRTAPPRRPPRRPRPWVLGAQPLPIGSDGNPEVLPTPPQLVDRQLPTVDVLPPPPDGGVPLDGRLHRCRDPRPHGFDVARGLPRGPRRFASRDAFVRRVRREGPHG